MSHEITDKDGLVLFQNPAWHGLGNIVQEAMTPNEALTLAGLDWLVGFPSSQSATFDLGHGEQIVPIRGGRTLFRLPRTPDEQFIEMGNFGLGYNPVQNHKLAEMAYAFGEQAKVESAGSVMQGKRVWFLLQMNSLDFSGDQVSTYMILSNTHDGSMAFSIFPTSVRVVCNNTLSLAMGQMGKGRFIRIKHSADVEARMKVVEETIKAYRGMEDGFVQVVNALQGQKVKSEQEITNFWKQIQEKLYGAVTKQNERLVVERATRWDEILKGEMMQLGVDTPDYWLLSNAVTNQMQHRDPAWGEATQSWNENQLYGSLFGEIAVDSSSVFNLALSHR